MGITAPSIHEPAREALLRAAAALLLALGQVAAGGGISTVSTEQARKILFQEYEARAAFLLVFAKYTAWPSEPSSDPFVIGVMGEVPFSAAFEKLSQGRLGERKVLVKRFSCPLDVQPCHILYFPSSEERFLEVLKPKLAAGSVLTVGETGRFLGMGGALHLFEEGGRLRFEVNRTVLEQSRLRVEAKALNLAKHVISRP